MSEAQDPSFLLSHLAQVWTAEVDATPAGLRDTIAAIVEQQGAKIAEQFYQYMLEDEHARSFLDHEVVRQRLQREMERWLRSLFPASNKQQSEAQVAQQVAVGAVHARIKLPVELLTVGAHVLSRALVVALAERLPEAAERALATHYIMQLFSFATGLIMSAFVRETQRGVRNEEAYRQLVFRHDAALERERQRATLSEWAQRCLMALPNPTRRAGIVPLRKSEFAQWLVHKGRALFDGVPEFDAVNSAMEHIDFVILPQLLTQRTDEESYSSLLDEFDSRIEFIRYSLNDMFERVPQADAGRDAVTRLLNRRYLNSILAREVDTYAHSAQPFTVSLLRVAGIHNANLGIDNDDARNSVLQRVAMTLTDHAGAGDHVFRYTDSDFLMVEVDSDLSRSLERQQRLWQRLDEALRSRAGQSGEISVRIVVAGADGHPDYQRLLRRVEFAIASMGDGQPVLAV